jgi:hypothetical protein
MRVMATRTTDATAERRADLARRIDLGREALRPYPGGDGEETRLARRAWHVLSDVASELVDDDEDSYA